MQFYDKMTLLVVIILLFYIVLGIFNNRVPVKINKDIEGTYFKIDGSEIIDINGSESEKFRKDTLTGSGPIKEITNFKFLGLKPFVKTKLFEVQKIKVKGLSGNNYYVTNIETGIKNNKPENTIELSHIKSGILNILDEKPDKKIIVSDNLTLLKKDMIVTLSDDNTISTNPNVKEKTIEHTVKDNTYYKYDKISESESTMILIIGICLIMFILVFYLKC